MTYTTTTTWAPGSASELSDQMRGSRYEDERYLEYVDDMSRMFPEEVVTQKVEEDYSHRLAHVPKVPSAQVEPVPTLDPEILRIRYEDDPVALAMIDALEWRDRRISDDMATIQAMTGFLDMTRRDLDIHRDMALDLQALVRSLRKSYRSHIRKLLGQAERHRELIEEVAVATGRWKARTPADDTYRPPTIKNARHTTGRFRG